MQTITDLSTFQVVYQDAYLVAIHKPAGLLMHRSPIDRHETQFAMQMTRDRIQQHVYPVHRLDKATSGIVLFALDPDTAHHLSEQFRQQQIVKHYLAIVRGWTPTEGIIEHALKPQHDKTADRDATTDKAPQEATTLYKRLATTEVNHPVGRYPSARYSLLHLEPKTGRNHQLRRHLNHISHPIVGDVAHGDRHHNHFFNQWTGQHRLYLAATRIRFIHPVTNDSITLEADLEPSFQCTLDKLEFKNGDAF